MKTIINSEDDHTQEIIKDLRHLHQYCLSIFDTPVKARGIDRKTDKSYIIWLMKRINVYLCKAQHTFNAKEEKALSAIISGLPDFQSALLYSDRGSEQAMEIQSFLDNIRQIIDSIAQRQRNDEP